MACPLGIQGGWSRRDTRWVVQEGDNVSGPGGRWQGRIVAVYMMIRQQMVCAFCVYGPQTGRTESDKEVFREEVERLVGLRDGQTMLSVASDFNAHFGVVEPAERRNHRKI